MGLTETAWEYLTSARSLTEPAWEYLTSARGLPVLGVSVLSIYWLLTGKKDKRPPFPFYRLPLVGNMITLLRSKEMAYVLFYKTSMKPEYEKVFMIKVGARDMCILNHIDVVREALIHKAEHFANRLNLFSGLASSNGGLSLFMGNYGPVWRFQRKVVHQALRSFASGVKLNDFVNDSTSRVMELLTQQSGSFHVKSMLELLVFNVLTGVLYGKQYDLHDPDFIEFQGITKAEIEAFGMGLPADYFPWLSFIPLSIQGPKLKKLMKLLQDRLRKEWTEAKENFDPGNPQHLVDYLILTQRQLEEDNPENKGMLDDEAVVFVTQDMFTATLDTVTATLRYCVLNAMQHSEAQEKIAAEARDVIGERLPMISDRSKLPYTEAFLCEVLRHDNFLPLTGFVQTTCDTNIGKYELPKGTDVMFNMWALHHDPDYWENPSEFNPDRFLDNSAQLAHRPDSFLPFSAGKRVCPGEGLAKAVLMIILPQLFKNLKFTIPDDFGYESDDNGFTHLPNDFKVSVEVRIG